MTGVYDMMQRLAKVSDLSEEPLPGLPLIEVAGESRVLIENHSGVTQYGKETIRVRVKFGQVCIEGSSLTLARMSKGQLVISGCIDSIRLLRGC